MHITSLPSLRRLGALLAAGASAAVLTGCGLSNPNTATLGSSPTTPTSTSTASSPTAASTSQSTVRGAGGSTPQAAIVQYARLWCNWTTADLRSHERQLEALSVGGARTQQQLALAAAAQPRDSDVPQSGASSAATNTCTLEALTQGRGNAAGKWVLVTASHTSTPNMPRLPAQYHVTYVTLARHGRQYLVSGWLPQS